MSLTPEQEADAVEYLRPLALASSGKYERRFGKARGDLYTVALEAAWLAVREYRAEDYPSLWRHASVTIPRRLVDAERVESGRDGTGRHAGNEATTPLGLFRPDSGDGDGTEHYLDPYTDPGYAEVEARETVNVILEGVSPMHRQILEARYVEGVSTEALAESFGVDPSTMSTLTTEALAAARRVAA